MDDNAPPQEGQVEQGNQSSKRGMTLLVALTEEERGLLQQAIADGKLEQYGIPKTVVLTVEEAEMTRIATTRARKRTDGCKQR